MKSSKIAVGGYGGTLPVGAPSGRVAVMSPPSQLHTLEKNTTAKGCFTRTHGKSCQRYAVLLT